jgi:hypothetical protein
LMSLAEGLQQSYFRLIDLFSASFQFSTTHPPSNDAIIVLLSGSRALVTGPMLLTGFAKRNHGRITPTISMVRIGESD